MTKTTEKRIKAVIDQFVWASAVGAPVKGTSQAAYEIATELDTLAKERDDYRAGYNRLAQELAKAQAEIAKLTVKLVNARLAITFPDTATRAAKDGPHA